MKYHVRNWLLISLIVAGVVSLFASAYPDGYEKAGEQLGYIDKAIVQYKSPFPDYQLPGVESWWSGSISGVIGVLVTFFIFVGLGSFMGKRK
jgi:cobalt/nickel transport protein